MGFFSGLGRGQDVFFNHLNRNDSTGSVYSAFYKCFGWTPCFVDIGLFQIQKTKKQGGFRIHFLKKLLECFYFTSGNFREKKAPPQEIPKNRVRCLRNCNAKNQDPWKFHIIFLVTLRNSTSVLINLWKFHVLFLWYSWKFHILNARPLHPPTQTPIWFYSGLAYFKLSPGPKKSNFSYSLTDPTELCLG